MSDELRERDQRAIWHPFTQMSDWLDSRPVVIERGEGNYLIDSDGTRYFDAVSSLWVNLHGHDHPVIRQALHEQLDKLARAIPPQWYAVFATMSFTGLRFGEASALMWDDIDHKHGLIYIRRGNWRGQVVEPKTAKSRRSVPMVPQLVSTAPR